MNKSALLVAILFSATALAQSNTTPRNIWEPSAEMTEGVRVSLLKPMGDFKIKASALGESASATTSMNDALGVSVGYASLPVRQVGWIAGASLIDAKLKGEDTSTSMNFLRGEGNIAYAANENIYFKGGLNLSKMTKGPSASEWSTGIGYQVGAGAQFTPTFGGELTYGETNQSINKGLITVELKEVGPELSVHATF